ncbi:putative ABC multidrug transporter [Aspergillus clavatus NRRL 1]|uniref:ABC multidrug transporter, putative n=1 Tax=Aspergillus clavatus (strain ATCC 1007 / CBS 513.65 / DSM 816 / NCTC 3887 / NRRL 1 / QM 1276 / 107) TaxID=344612 RepID=A1CQ77_ASPCL|nr:ABC multidrug transporter, putative [Aspergillus clavatus NRRL 1]EAW07798.1 ABC multidrug transporter, putative [Aspergillus clavatus NRRL 1]
MTAASPSLSCQQVDNTLQVPALSCRGGFDFSLLFEELILGILPLGIVLVLALFRLWHLFRRQRKVVASCLLWTKIIAWLALGIVQLVLTVYWARPSASRTRASIAANAVTTAGISILCLLSYAEHIHSVTPSFLLNVYLFITLLFDAAKARTLWLRINGGVDLPLAILTSVTVGIKCLLFVLEAIEKRHILRKEYAGYPPEATAGIFNRAFFVWLNPLFHHGFSRLLAVEDLFELDKQLSSKRLHNALETRWNKVPRKGSNSLLFLCFRAFKWPLLSAVPPRACLAALNFCQPLLLRRSLLFSTQPVTSHTNSIGYGLIGAYILVYTGMGVMMGQYQHLTYRAITMVRGAIVSMIYNKASRLSVKDADPAASLTLMSADVERIVQGWQTIHDIWGNAAEIALAIYLLETQLGVACAVPVGVAVVALFGCMIALAFVMARQALWLEAIERRISSTASMLGSMKGVKMLGLKSSIMASVHGLRLDELSISKKFRKLLVWNMALAWTTRIFAPIFALGAFIGISHARGQDSAFNMSTAYTSLSLFALLSDPLLNLVMALMTFIGSVGSFRRVQDFLEKEDHVDYRQRAPDASYDSIEPKPLMLVDDSDVMTSESASDRTPKRALSSSYHDALIVQNASFGWDIEQEPLLKDLTITVPRGSFTMIVGPSGCGKSTLLKAILGEVPCVNGTLDLSSDSVAFCDQTPWHMNASIRESITAMSSFDKEWYASVVRACALVPDFEQLPRGDETVIGSKGIALSGGQSQRIAIARAVYARRSIVILDDAFSGLDAATEDYIFHSLVGIYGFLRALGCTIIVAASSAKRLPYADHIVALDKTGHISEQGSFKALDLAGGYVSSFALGSPDWKTKVDKPPVEEKPQTKIKSEGKTEVIKTDPRRQCGDLSIYLYYIQSIGWFPTAVFLVSISAFVFCISFPSIWVKWWAGANEVDPNGRTGYYLGIYAMLGAVGMFALIVGCWEMVINMVPKSGESFHRRLLTTVLSAPMSFFAATDSGSILNRFSQDLQLIDMELPVAAINTFATLMLCLAQMILMGIASKYAAISFPMVLLVVYSIQKVYLRTSRQLRFLDIEAKAPLYSHFSDSLNGLVTLRAFGWQQSLEEKNRELLDYSQRPFYLLYAIQRWLTLTLDMVVAGIAVILIVLVVTLRGTISAGDVGVALLNVILFSQSIKLLITFWTNLETHIGSIVRVRSFTENVSSEDSPSEKDEVPSNWPWGGDIEFKSVSAEYRPGEPVLREVSLSIKAGEKVGICGRTGSGKTSLIMSIFRMVELSGGSILIDDIDITRIPRQEIRSRINGVAQSPLLIKGTVRHNINPTASSSEKAIVEALKAVGLYAKVQEKGGLDIDIDEVFLSHGQQQLFCLARAILRPGKVLVLDEATSNVDSKTDEIMQRVIREKFGSHTILSVAHKLETILDFDKVVVLDAGRVVECGNPYSLLADEKTYFSRLYASAMVEEGGDST